MERSSAALLKWVYRGMISSALLVQMNGSQRSFQATLVKVPRRMAWRVMMPRRSDLTVGEQGQRLIVLCRSASAVRRRYGIMRTARLLITELAFDLWYRTDTSLEASPPSSASGGVPLGDGRSKLDYPDGRHEACNPAVMRNMLRLLPSDAVTSGFLDYGCGKGRALLLAARYGFSRVVGVEVSAEFCAVAEGNVRRWRRTPRLGGASSVSVSIHHVDAAHFPVPDDVGVAFLFNPFDAATMAQALDRLGESLARHPRVFHILYVYPRHAALLRATGYEAVGECPGFGVLYRAGTDRADTER